MIVVLPIFAAFAAFCVWLTVRIVNRRERWATWTLATVVALPVFYVASFGPACWLSPTRRYPMFDHPQKVAPKIYQPLGLLIKHGPAPIADALKWYAAIGAEHILFSTGAAE